MGPELEPDEICPTSYAIFFFLFLFFLLFFLRLLLLVLDLRFFLFFSSEF